MVYFNSTISILVLLLVLYYAYRQYYSTWNMCWRLYYKSLTDDEKYKYDNGTKNSIIDIGDFKLDFYSLSGYRYVSLINNRDDKELYRLDNDTFMGEIKWKGLITRKEFRKILRDNKV